MLHAGLDLGRERVDICLLSESGEHLDQLAAPPDAEALGTLARLARDDHTVAVVTIAVSGCFALNPCCHRRYRARLLVLD